jgi:hypothetical protein
MLYSRLRRRHEAVLADVIGLRLSELRFHHLGGYRSITAHADGIECPIVIRPMVERRLGRHPVGQSAGLSMARLNGEGEVACGEQPIGAPDRDYSVDRVLSRGIATANDRRETNTRPARTSLIAGIRSIDMSILLT